MWRAGAVGMHACFPKPAAARRHQARCCGWVHSLFTLLAYHCLASCFLSPSLQDRMDRSKEVTPADITGGALDKSDPVAGGCDCCCCCCRYCCFMSRSRMRCQPVLSPCRLLHMRRQISHCRHCTAYKSLYSPRANHWTLCLLQWRRWTCSCPSWAPRRGTWRCAHWPPAACTCAAASPRG